MHISGKTFGGLKINIDLWGEWVGKVKYIPYTYKQIYYD
jgi:hypothetical protein